MSSSFKIPGYSTHILSEYCGLGPSSGIPRHALDAACKRHDEGYEALLQAGHSKWEVYGRFNRYDREFLEFIKTNVAQDYHEYYLQKAAEGIFKLKRDLRPEGKLILQNATFDKRRNSKV